MTLEEYLNNPCAALSIPYWKHQVISIPQSVSIYHETQFNQMEEKPHPCESYFRLIHHLNAIPEPITEVVTIDIQRDLQGLIALINLCYADQRISVDENVVFSWLKRSVYNSSLWVKIVRDGKMIAAGIAEYDLETQEGVLEWIQVDPAYSKRGFGKMIVNELVNRLSHLARFITVSGKVDNATKPEMLYRQCGFEGQDVWYVCHVGAKK